MNPRSKRKLIWLQQQSQDLRTTTSYLKISLGQIETPCDDFFATKDYNYSIYRYSLLYLPYPVMVPGGRFREIYYWDCFWIIRGLIQSEMLSTAKGNFECFCYSNLVIV